MNGVLKAFASNNNNNNSNSNTNKINEDKKYKVAQVSDIKLGKAKILTVLNEDEIRNTVYRGKYMQLLKIYSILNK